ncbi:hypothetical protein Droror1_Dr00025185 [Drosera rotundifolia]
MVRGFRVPRGGGRRSVGCQTSRAVRASPLVLVSSMRRRRNGEGCPVHGLMARGGEADSNLDGGDAGEGGVGVAGSGQEMRVCSLFLAWAWCTEACAAFGFGGYG